MVFSKSVNGIKITLTESVNGKELYMFLWDECAEMAIRYLTEFGCYEQKDLFESMERGLRAKMEICRLYPDMANFTIKAFYEKDTDIWEMAQRGNVDIEEMEKGFSRLMNFWKSIYLRKE